MKFYVALMLVGRGMEVIKRLGEYDSLEDAIVAIKADMAGEEYSQEELNDMDLVPRPSDMTNKIGNRVWDFGTGDMSYTVMTNEYPSVGNMC